MNTQSQIIRSITEEIIEDLKKKDSLPPPEEIEKEILNKQSMEIVAINALKEKGDSKLKVPTTLAPGQVALLLAIYYPIIRIKSPSGDAKYDMLVIYDEKEGIYKTDLNLFQAKVSKFLYPFSKREFDDIIFSLHGIVERKERNLDPDLIPVGNGIFNYKTKELSPFDKDKVFLTKSNVNYNPKAKNPVIHNTEDNTYWDIESWMGDLSDDPEIVNLLWEILGAIIRPNTRWDKSAWLFSTEGNNGKGTLCELMRNLCGNSHCSIPINDFGKDFLLEPLTRSSAIIVDENDVGTFIDKASKLKACITNDVIFINRKHESPISYQFRGFMVQCLNEYPKTKDKSNSFYRRQLFIPFNKCFTGKERKYIKDDYLHRKDVLEYVLFKVLNMNYYKLSEPAACTNVLSEYKEYNDPVLEFWNDTKDRFVWDLLPFSFLYDCFKAWLSKNAPEAKVQGRNKFINELITVIKPEDDWVCPGKDVRIRTGTKMDKTENLLFEFGLDKEYEYTNLNASKRVVKTEKLIDFEKKEVYRGLIRKTKEEIKEKEIS